MPTERVWKVELHCHSSFSDGTQTPEQVAEELATSGVGHAALTDHNTTAGQERFRLALEHHGVRSSTGLELDALMPWGPVHLLAYGFDEHHISLQRALRGVRHPHWDRLIRGWWPRRLRELHAPMALVLGPGQGALGAGEAIRLLHRAGARVFLAHPLTVATLDELDDRLQGLKALGLDGLEVHYKPYDEVTRRGLRLLAERHGLLVGGGSDYHGPGSGLGGATPGIEMPEADWLPMARALGWAGERFASGEDAIRRSLLRPHQLRAFLLHIGLPATLAVLLFALALFGVLLPAMENQLLDRKKEMIRELTRAAASILQEYQDEADAGIMPEAQARREAAERIERLRYGEQGKDYFWITDMHPRMVMHPWRKDLNGQDLSGFTDLAGERVFVAFVDAVRDRESGYVAYFWQWKDDPDQIVPKLSYVQAFRPWGWVIGTGIYTQDVKAEIGRVRNRLVTLSLAIYAAVALLLLYSARQSFSLELRRARTERELAETNEKYRALVEASTEGTLMVLEGDCAYANGPMEALLGAGPGELTGLPILELLAGECRSDDAVRSTIRALLDGEPALAEFEARLLRRDGAIVEVLLSPSSISFDGRRGFILAVRDIRGHKELTAALQRSRIHYRKLTRAIHMGVFRSQWRPAHLMEANPAMRTLLGLSHDDPLEEFDWLARIADDDTRDELVARLERDESVELHRVMMRRMDGHQAATRLFAVLVREDDRTVCDGVLEDITERSRGEAEREELISQLQTSLFYLQEPVGPAVRPAPTLSPSRTVAEAAARMSAGNSSALVVVTEDGDPVGLVTDRDFRARVSAAGLDPGRPVREIMSAPLATISIHALVYEAILLMQERSIGHLAVLDDAGRLAGLLRDRHLIHFRHYSSLILAQSIHRAQSAAEIAEAMTRLPRLVQAMIASGTRMRAINRMASSAADAAVERLLALAIQELGPPPGRFSFLAMGSEGRQEQTLLTDQDNGVVYADPPAGCETEWATYFLALGARVSQGLAQAGYKECLGGVMAGNPRWNKSRSAWLADFTRWIRTADPQELLDLNIAFDFRCVGGDASLAHEMRRLVHLEIDAHPPFMLHLAQNALLAKPPLGLRGNILVHAAGEGPKSLNLKEALLPVVNYGRLYALRHRIEETHTLDRLNRLHELGRLSKESLDELVADYEAVQRMRLGRQAAALLEGREPGNLVSPQDWTALEEAMLKRLFALTGDLRKKISYDFLGMA